MSRLRMTLPAWLAAGALLLLIVSLAAAELADLYLRNGLWLRGDLSEENGALALRNALGAVRYDREDVARVDWVAAPPAPANQMIEERAATEEDEATGVESAALAAPPLLSATDIQRLKMSELRTDGVPEDVRVRYVDPGGQRAVLDAVLEELRARDDYDPAWEDTLRQGSLQEKLQLIVRETGTQFADRIHIVNDPEVFDLYRERVLPVVVNGCGRVGCHAGPRSRVFRFPRGSTRTGDYAYTTFALLDSLETNRGPLIDRADPEASVLLGYLMPMDQTDTPHPPVSGRRRVVPILKSRLSPLYGDVLSWLERLKHPRPDYGLEAGWLVPPAVEEEDAAP